MAYCDKCGNFDKSHVEDWDLKLHSNELSYQPDLYYYWDSPIEEDLIGETHTQKLTVYVKSVLILPTQRRKLNGNYQEVNTSYDSL